MTTKPVADYTLRPEADLFRIYQRELDDGRSGSPVWFCGGTRICRYDLQDGHGTCHTSETREGAFIERFMRIAGDGVPPRSVTDRHLLAHLSVKDSLRLVDLNVNSNLGATLGSVLIDRNLILEVTEDYPLSRAFAQEAYTAHFEGVRWKSLCDLPMERFNCALFSQFSGDDDGKIFDVQTTGPIPPDLIASMEAEFGDQLGPPSGYPLK
ncbi:RES family NAD+ phosphorylase [Streptomyces abikoensis]|uniref:RES family NAD+ phosphorylase n=1 Tax=Streptomyces abikoensis TaxID=97398 RepID=UPI0033EE7502